MLRIEQLYFGYDDHEVLRVEQLTVDQGEHFLFLGNSGSGKTTLLHLVAGLLRPRQGTLIVADRDITQLSPTALDKFRGQHIGLVFQQPHLVSALSVQQNLELAQYLAGLPTDRSRIGEVLDQLGVKHKRRARVSALSQGEAQRIAIARALLNQPRIILADEPTASLDDTNCERVLNLLREQAYLHRATLLIATHDQRIKDQIPAHFTLTPASP